jgi:hypothetical protein
MLQAGRTKGDLREEIPIHSPGYVAHTARFWVRSRVLEQVGKKGVEDGLPERTDG